MEISEAAKRAAREIWGMNSGYVCEEVFDFSTTAEMVQAAIDAEAAELRKIIDDCLATMPVGNMRTHTPESLPDRIRDLASELGRLDIRNEALVEAMKKAKTLFCKPDEAMQKFPNWANAIVVIDAALKAAGEPQQNDRLPMG